MPQLTITICYLVFAIIVPNYAFTCLNGDETPDDNYCSNVAQCADCSDEVNCPGQNDFLSCQDKSGLKSCVSNNTFCDGEQNCNNCFDELDCNDSLPLFFCTDNETCVAFRKSRCSEEIQCNAFCDGKSHCNDTSDEKQVGFGFKCSPNDGVLDPRSCIVPQQYLKRGFQFPEFTICENNADKCFISIAENRIVFNESSCWTCLDGTIIQRTQVCDEVFDCPDLSDECLCFDETISNVCELMLGNIDCGANEVSCPVDGTCISVSKVCDESPDCTDNFDELYCINNTITNCKRELTAEEESGCDDVK